MSYCKTNMLKYCENSNDSFTIMQNIIVRKFNTLDENYGNATIAMRWNTWYINRKCVYFSLVRLVHPYFYEYHFNFEWIIVRERNNDGNFTCLKSELPQVIDDGTYRIEWSCESLQSLVRLAFQLNWKNESLTFQKEA